MPGVCGVDARRLASLCAFESASPECETGGPPLPARAPRWTVEATERGLVSCGAMLARGGCGSLPALARVCAARGSRLVFHTPPLPMWLRDAPNGHLAAAMATGVVDLCEHPSVDGLRTRAPCTAQRA